MELGPVFANVVLADEVNRAPAKVQSALLEVMAEGHVSIGGTTYPVPDPFLVLATQNPIESDGVYPLPEAQRDRFLMKVLVDYPSGREEAEIVRRMGGGRPVARPVLSLDAVRALQAGDRGRVRPRRGARLRRPPRPRHPRAGPARPRRARRPVIAHGASPRATLGLVAAGRALALLRGRSYVLPQDVYDVARDVLRHRVLLSYDAIADGVDVEDVVERLVARVTAPRVSPSQDGPVVHQTRSPRRELRRLRRSPPSWSPPSRPLRRAGAADHPPARRAWSTATTDGLGHGLGHRRRATPGRTSPATTSGASTGT